MIYRPSVPAAVQRHSESPPLLAKAAALSALGRGSGPFRAMFTEARHRPFVMVSMCVCKCACEWGKGGGGGKGNTTEKRSHLLSSSHVLIGLSLLAYDRVAV